MEQILETVKSWLALYGLKVIGGVIILVVGIMLAKMITKIARRVMVHAKLDETLVTFGGNVLYGLLVVVVVVAALTQFGVDTTSIIAILGAASLAFALALQGNVANLASGVLILIFRPFKIGHLVDVGGSLGTVININIMNTVLKTADARIMVIPNSTVTGGKLINYSLEEVMRADLVFGISYEDDVVRAKGLLMKLLEEHPMVLKDPAPQVFLLELADSSVNLAVRPWVAAENYWGIRWDLNEKIKLLLDSEGISIPYPQRDVHLHQVQTGDQAAA